MTRWTIDGRGDTGTKAIHYQDGKRLTYNVQRLSSDFWLADIEYPDGSRFHLNAAERSESGAQARCEMHASGYRS